MTAIGSFAALMAALAFLAAIIRALLSDSERSHQNEMSAIGWGIFAVLCLKLG